MRPQLGHHPIGLRILGVDPGLNTTGYAVLEVGETRPHLCEAGVIRSNETPRDASDMAPRLRTLYDGLVEVFEQYKPGAMSIEQLYAHYEHPRTAILMAHARGAFLLAAGLREVPTFSYAASRIKKAVTGNGRASKEQVQQAMQRELGLSAPPEPYDVADALAAALCHYFIPDLKNRFAKFGVCDEDDE